MIQQKGSHISLYINEMECLKKNHSYCSIISFALQSDTMEDERKTISSIRLLSSDNRGLGGRPNLECKRSKGKTLET